MLTIAPDDLLSFAKRFDGKHLRTLHECKTFDVRFQADVLIFTPRSTGKDRPHERPYIENVCAQFSETNSLHPGDYRDGTYNASYTLALIAAYLGAVAQGEFEPAKRPARTAGPHPLT